MLHLTDEAVMRLADPSKLVDEVENCFIAAPNAPSRMHCELPGEDGAQLLVMPAWLSREAIGVKVATVMPCNRDLGRPTIDGLYVLLDGKTGQPRASISAAALTTVRTAAVSAVASRRLSRVDSSRLLVVGTGALSVQMARAHCAVRQIREIFIWGRSFDRATRVAQQLQQQGIEAQPVVELSAAAKAADIISCCTASRGPLVLADDVQPGTHLDLVGSFTPEMREVDPQVFERARLVVDTFDAFEKSGDLLMPDRLGLIDRRKTLDLAALLSRPVLDKSNAGEVTVFKSVGTALSDLAAAVFLHSVASGIPSHAPELDKKHIPQFTSSRLSDGEVP